MPKNSPKKIAYNNGWTNAHYDRISLAVPSGGRERIKAAADAAGQSVNAYIQAAIDAAITGQPMQATANAPQSPQGSAWAEVPPGVLNKAKAAAAAADRPVAEWLSEAVEKKIKTDELARKLNSLAPAAPKAEEQATPKELDVDALMANIKCHPDCEGKAHTTQK